jgi:hypothetical protein
MMQIVPDLVSCIDYLEWNDVIAKVYFAKRYRNEQIRHDRKIKEIVFIK